MSLLLHLGFFFFLFYFHAAAIPRIDEFRELVEFKLENKAQQSSGVSLPDRAVQKTQAPHPVVKPKVSTVNPPKVASELKTDVVQNVEPPQPEVKQDVTNKQEEVIKAPVTEKTELAPTPHKKMMVNSEIDSESNEIKGAWGKYAHQLAEEAYQVRTYPSQAIASRWKGVVIVAITINGEGLAEVQIRQSSGYAVLDQEAKRMIDYALKKVALPEGLKNKPKEFLVPIGFKF